MFKIKTAFTLLFGSVIAFLILILFAFTALLQNRRESDNTQFGQFQSIHISDKLRERNDDLTHFCLNYIITGDSVWEKAYQELAESATYRFPKKEQGFVILEDSIRNLGFGKDEYDLIKKAVDLSNVLNKNEANIFAEVKVQADVGTNEWKRRREKALKMISSNEYLSVKRELVKTIVNFETNIRTHTDKAQAQNVKQGIFLYYTVLVLLIVVTVFSILAFYLILKRVKKEAKLDELFKQQVEDLKKTQKELMISDERFVLAVDGSGARIWDYWIEEGQLMWSPANLSLLGYAPNEISGNMDFLMRVMHVDDRNKFDQQLNNHINNGDPFNIDVRFYSKSGELRWCRCRGNSSRNNKGVSKRVVGIFLDITDRVKAEERATNAILETEDKERSRIARDIHDSLQQTMSTALLNFEKVRSSLHIEDELLDEKFKIGYQFLKKSIAESRTLAHNLMPKVVDNDGVAVAIESLVNALKGSTSTDLHFYQNLNEKRINLAAEMTLYRIVQEAVNNVIKYAAANECTIQLLMHENTVTLTIEDDGVGFEIDKMNDTFGLNSMKTRAQAIGAFFQLESAPGRGTQILIELSI